MLFAEHNSLVEVSAPLGISYQSNVEDDNCDSSYYLKESFIATYAGSIYPSGLEVFFL